MAVELEMEEPVGKVGRAALEASVAQAGTGRIAPAIKVVQVPGETAVQVGTAVKVAKVQMEDKVEWVAAAVVLL